MPVDTTQVENKKTDDDVEKDIKQDLKEEVDHQVNDKNKEVTNVCTKVTAEGVLYSEAYVLDGHVSIVDSENENDHYHNVPTNEEDHEINNQSNNQSHKVSNIDNTKENMNPESKNVKYEPVSSKSKLSIDNHEKDFMLNSGHDIEYMTTHNVMIENSAHDHDNDDAQDKRKNEHAQIIKIIDIVGQEGNDKNGNFTTKAKEFTVDPLFLLLLDIRLDNPGADLESEPIEANFDIEERSLDPVQDVFEILAADDLVINKADMPMDKLNRMQRHNLDLASELAIENPEHETSANDQQDEEPNMHSNLLEHHKIADDIGSGDEEAEAYSESGSGDDQEFQSQEMTNEAIRIFLERTFGNSTTTGAPTPEPPELRRESQQDLHKKLSTHLSHGGFRNSCI